MNGTQLGWIRATLQELALGDVAGAVKRMERMRDAADSDGMESLRRIVSHYSKGLANDDLEELNDSGDLGDIGDELNLCLLGWKFYYQARYEEAGDTFQKAWECGEAWESWTALGIGKVCSDLGWWNDAGRWILEAMGISRTESDLFRMAECAGALGEVFLRAGKPKVAWELFSLDKSILPPGSEYRSRLENYRALCLSRNGFPELAEPLLWGAYFAECESDSGSADYSFASLAAMSLRHDDTSLMKRLEIMSDEKLMNPTGMPGGIWNVVKAYWSWRENLNDAVSQRKKHQERSLELLAKARSCFGSSYPIEIYWVRCLEAEISAQPIPEDGELSRLLRRRYPKTKGLLNASLPAFEQVWSSIDLPKEWGFISMNPYQSNPSWKMIDLFFV